MFVGFLKFYPEGGGAQRAYAGGKYKMKEKMKRRKRKGKKGRRGKKSIFSKSMCYKLQVITHYSLSSCSKCFGNFY